MADDLNIFSRLRNAWNVFVDRNANDPQQLSGQGPGSSRPEHKVRFRRPGDKSIITSIYARIAVDVSVLSMKHVRVDGNDSYIETINSGLNSCLTVQANIDQTHTAFLEDVVMSMFDEGIVAIVAVDKLTSLNDSGKVDVLTLRTGKVVQWYPRHVRVELYNDTTGHRETVTLAKTNVALVENPFYSIMNEQNSVLQRLVRKLNILDVVDEIQGSGKLDLIIKLPYVVKSELRKKMAENRRQELEEQLTTSQYGVAYTDGTEEIIQLNRAVENNIMPQVEYLTRMLYNQLAISEKILSGTADEIELLNYHARVILPIAKAITNEMRRKFLTNTAISQGQSIMFFRNYFSIVTPERLANLIDKLINGEVATSNEVRAVIGWQPSKDPEADQLRNKNINPKPDASVGKPLDVGGEFNRLKTKKENQNDSRKV